MARPAVSVSPYWELAFDSDGEPDARARDRLLAGVARHGVRDLLVFAHGWNNDRSGATRLYDRFFAPVPELVPAARIGYVGVVWPSMRFADEPIPGVPRAVAAELPPPPVLDKDTRHALLETFPGRATVIDQLARLLEQQSGDEAELEEFGRLVRLLVDLVPPGPQALFAADTLAEGVPQDEPTMFDGTAGVRCEEFARALAWLESPDAAPDASFTLPSPWEGAHELLRQATYFAMKRRAGTVGERGLGRLVGELAARSPEVRVHLVGHSFGGRLVSFALRGLPRGVRTVKSVTLLQGAFSHYAFSARLPHDARAGGVLHGQHNRVDGPLVCCFSRHDDALGTMYPLASRMAGHDREFHGFDIGRALGAKWGALGFDGIQAVPGTRHLKLAEALRGPLPTAGCVNVDASAVVRRGGPPAGAHSDIVHRELARLVLTAGRVR
ncbi:serine-threonine protein kinase [Streptomyces sp. YS415]|uniref:serine-threonine protein kinase n=1 Tax=Streptomyces sp. YS415 TaxID=2944806 RepID=UPI002021AC32|nr:serine-threonine protein kinase [Streptomyces sp. YS415]MCL7428791.1 serine-threonine protein kinase [Streptomyces sp. YS415]